MFDLEYKKKWKTVWHTHTQANEGTSVCSYEKEGGEYNIYAINQSVYDVMYS